MTCTSFKFSALILVAAVISLVAYGRRFNSGVYIDANGNQIVFSNFVAYLDSFLNVSAMVSKFTTTSEDCQNLCMLTTSCLSVNVALTPDDKGRKLCQMLSTTKDIKPDHFGPSKAFYHLTTIPVPCFSQPCQQGGTCRQYDGKGTFTCECSPGREGQLCEIASTGWLKVNINGPVCFGAKDDAFGRFTLQFTGDIISLKLVHVSGSLSASRAAAGGNWGYRSNKIGILITGVENVVGLPENYTAFEPYTMEGYTGRSPELVFPNFSAPFTAPRGMEARIWFVEDLGNFSENDNSGVSCADVYLFYI